MSVDVRLTSSRDDDDVTFQERHLILVEGQDDRALLAAMIKHEELPGFQVHHMGGKSKWAVRVEVIVGQPEFQANVKTLGLMKDADEDPNAAWASCRDTLARSSLPVPVAVRRLAEGSPSTAIAIVPSRTGRGALEELCIESFDAGRIDCVNRYFDCVRPGNSSPVRVKARVQAYLAGLESAPRDITIAARNHELNMNHSAFDELREFVHLLSDNAAQV